VSERNQERNEERKEGRVKVSDRRIFTREGELKEEFRHLGESQPEKAEERGAPEKESPTRDAQTRDAPMRDAPMRDAPSRRAPSGDAPGRRSPAERMPVGQPSTGGQLADRGPEADAPPRVEGFPERRGGGPGFLDLIGLLAEPASLYLREAQVGEVGTVAAQSQAEQNLELARLHIELLEVLRDKTAGNLDPREKATIDDVIRRLQAAYVQTAR